MALVAEELKKKLCPECREMIIAEEMQLLIFDHVNVRRVHLKDSDTGSDEDDNAFEAVGFDSSDFEFHEIIGHGNFGNTYKAIVAFEDSKYTYAIRVLKNTPNIRSHVLKEVQYQGPFEHRNFLGFFSYFSDNDYIYLILEHPSKGHISELKQLDDKLAAALVHQLVSAILFSHAHGMTHRRITFDKLFLHLDNVLKVADFGRCIHEDPHQHDEADDVRDIIKVTLRLLSRIEISDYAREFVSVNHVSLQALASHRWLPDE